MGGWAVAVGRQQVLGDGRGGGQVAARELVDGWQHDTAGGRGGAKGRGQRGVGGGGGSGVHVEVLQKVCQHTFSLLQAKLLQTACRAGHREDRKGYFVSWLRYSLGDVLILGQG